MAIWSLEIADGGDLGQFIEKEIGQVVVANKIIEHAPGTGQQLLGLALPPQQAKTVASRCLSIERLLSTRSGWHP